MRKRLQELNRGPLAFKKRADRPAQSPVTEGAAPDDSPPARPAPATPLALEEAAPGDVVESPGGSVYVIRRSCRQVMPDADGLLKRYQRVLVGGNASWREGSLHPDLRPMLTIDPRRVLFLDIETTGLSASPLFLIGVMSYSGGDLHLRQLFARDYSEERAVIAHFAETLRHYDALVSFNGKSFDLPYIADRGIVHGVRVTHGGPHVDLLYEARRRWRGRLPNCKLQTLERHLCDRVRVGDIPGEMIPQAYHDFVHSGSAHQVSTILHHNALDLVTMSEILLVMIEGDGE